MRFHVTCTNPKTGQTHEFELDAHDHGEARQEVLNAGLVVGRIEPATGDRHPDPPPHPHATAAEQETLQERRRVGIAGRIIGGCGIVAIVLAAVGTMLSGGSEDFTFHEIQASVRFDGAGFRIVNMDDFAWHDVLVDVNGGLANRGYTLRWDVLVAQQAIVAVADDFVNEKGRHYDPVKEPLRQLRIICDIGDGKKALHTRRWSPQPQASIPNSPAGSGSR